MALLFCVESFGSGLCIGGIDWGPLWYLTIQGIKPIEWPPFVAQLCTSVVDYNALSDFGLFFGCIFPFEVFCKEC